MWLIATCLNSFSSRLMSTMICWLVGAVLRSLIGAAFAVCWPRLVSALAACCAVVWARVKASSREMARGLSTFTGELIAWAMILHSLSSARAVARAVWSRFTSTRLSGSRCSLSRNGSEPASSGWSLPYWSRKWTRSRANEVGSLSSVSLTRSSNDSVRPDIGSARTWSNFSTTSGSSTLDMVCTWASNHSAKRPQASCEVNHVPQVAGR